MSLVYYGGAQEIHEAYSFFVLPGDDDGLEDLDTLSLYHDREELVWKLSSEDWISETIENEVWIGSRNISMSGGGPLPRGRFRAVLTDKGGSRGERVLVFDGPEKSRYPFPVLVIEGGRYSIESAYPYHTMLWYDGSGAYLGARRVGALAGTIRELEAPRETKSAALWAEDPEHYTSALTAVVPLN
jgi:hypothetical protein